ncbi:hypothetical protein KOR34_34210 [Posidoniimonas corsicana]|uniref:Ice-binding protein C-terminal domain-containing protein n=1 Tax=Posidoniimonas corsicana TaxID=1938618 RepID=A0A5C5V6Q6_9BACT|nr:PEP-CTERM sorting domain-containing protein [Posidoniimonas corsicana]TWT33589.1 hypothetical protein KOR34_34210 [Posidoniimonas corsicana]
MKHWICFPLMSALIAAASASAQTPLPVSIDGAGTADFLSAVPTDFAPFNATGMINFRGESLPYELTSADVGGVMITDPGPPLVADFSNSVPVTFSSTAPGDGSQISLNYQGVVTLTPVSATEFTAEFVADFTPIAGTGAGLFDGVVGGSFEMTAVVSQPFVPKLDPSQVDGYSLDIPFTWMTTGGANDVFQVVPEPATAWLALVGAVAAARRRRAA